MGEFLFSKLSDLISTKKELSESSFFSLSLNFLHFTYKKTNDTDSD